MMDLFITFLMSLVLSVDVDIVASFGNRVIRLGDVGIGWDVEPEGSIILKRVGQSWSGGQPNPGWQPPSGQDGSSWPVQSKDYDDSGSWKEWDQPPQQQQQQQQPQPVSPQPQPQGNMKGSRYPDQEPQEGRLEDLLKGIPGQDYPNFSTVPQTSFDCNAQATRGYYGDVEAGCQVFHICQPEGKKDSFLCPVGTIFNQKYFVCDWWFNVNCSDTPSYYELNAEVYKDVPQAEVVTQVTTERPKLPRPTQPSVKGKPPAAGSWGGPTQSQARPPAKPAGGWGGAMQGPPKAQRPSGWDSTKGSASSNTWNQGSSSSQASSWGQNNAWKNAEIRSDNSVAWNDASSSSGYITNLEQHRRGASTLNGVFAKQPNNPQWSDQGINAISPRSNAKQLQSVRSYNDPPSSFGARMKEQHATTMSPGVWQPTGPSVLEPTTLRRGLSHQTPGNPNINNNWFVEQANPTQFSTQSTSINPTGVKGVWVQESNNQQHQQQYQQQHNNNNNNNNNNENIWYDNDNDYDYGPSGQYNDRDTPSPTELIPDYETIGRENPYKSESNHQQNYADVEIHRKENNNWSNTMTEPSDYTYSTWLDHMRDEMVNDDRSVAGQGTIAPSTLAPMGNHNNSDSNHFNKVNKVNNFVKSASTQVNSYPVWGQRLGRRADTDSSH